MDRLKTLLQTDRSVYMSSIDVAHFAWVVAKCKCKVYDSQHHQPLLRIFHSRSIHLVCLSLQLIHLLDFEDGLDCIHGATSFGCEEK